MSTLFSWINYRRLLKLSKIMKKILYKYLYIGNDLILIEEKDE